MKTTVIIILFLCSIISNAQIKPNITYDSTSGNYTIEYMGEDSLVHVLFEPSTKITPFISVNINYNKNLDSYTYNYSVKNDITSKQRVQDFDIELLSEIYDIKSPDGFWKTSHYSFTNVFGWYHSIGDAGLADPYNGIAPGSTLQGFTFKSKGLPGISHAYFMGNHTITLAFPDEPPGEITELLRPLEKFPNNTVKRKTIGPKDPPAIFVAKDFIDTLLTYNTQAYNLGWVKNQTVYNNYARFLNRVRNNINNNDCEELLEDMEEFIEDLREDKEDKKITEEAYVLLKYNLEYLLKEIRKTCKEEDD